MKAFGDMGDLAPETPIRDIVDRCRVWESHADSVDKRGRGPGPERALPIYMVDDVGEAGDDLPVVAVTASPTAPELLDSLLRRLFRHRISLQYSELVLLLQ